MNRVRVKICGIREAAEAEAAVEAGADALGFNFWPGSSRYVEPEKARGIIRSVGPFVSCVGVFVNERADKIRAVADKAGLDAIQLHGDEPPGFCLEFPNLKVIKALRVRAGFQPATLADYPAAAVLLDAAVPGSYGGTGERFDWGMAAEATGYARIILAGGLTPENVGEAIGSVRPFAVDVCSGVESEPGRKDLARLRRFMAAALAANTGLERQADTGVPAPVHTAGFLQGER